MRYVFILAAAFFMVGVNAGWAENSAGENTMVKKPAQEEKREAIDNSKIKEVDLGGNEDTEGVEPAIGYGEGDRRVMPTWKNQDDNTGMPDNVESDVEGGIQ